MAAPLAGTTPTTPIPIPSASSTWSAMPWDSCSRSAIARWRAWLGNGSPVAAWSALIRPDVFRSVTMMSSPFAGVPSLPFNTANRAPLPRPAQTDDELDAELAKLSPPRKYYQNYQRTRGANDDMLHAPQGLHAFFRAYYHYKSADWKGNKPHPLKARTAAEMAKIPTYYVMERDKGMAATVAPFMP